MFVVVITVVSNATPVGHGECRQCIGVTAVRTINQRVVKANISEQLPRPKQRTGKNRRPLRLVTFRAVCGVGQHALRVARSRQYRMAACVGMYARSKGGRTPPPESVPLIVCGVTVARHTIAYSGSAVVCVRVDRFLRAARRREVTG